MKPILAVFLVYAGCAAGQRVFNQDDPHDEFKPTVKGMAERLAASEHVVLGTVIKRDEVPTRVFKQQLSEMQKLEEAGRDKEALEKWSRLEWGSTLSYFVVRVEKSLCQQADFLAGSATKSVPNEILLLNSWAAPLDAGYRNEILQPGRRYLFSLTRPADMAEKLDGFDLDKKQTYYEVLGHSDGAVELPSDADRGKPFSPAGYKADRDFASPVLEAATALCQAVAPANVFQKMDALERLKSSSDLSMRENAETALKLLDNNKR